MDMNDAIESAIQQMRAAGLDENTIELYRQQMIAAQQAAQFTAPEFTSFAKQSEDFAEQFQNPDFQAELAGTLLGNDEDELVMKENTTLTPAQQFGIACGADLAFLNGYSLNTLEEDVDQETIQEQLSEWWGIEDKKDLLEILVSLSQGRHCVEFNVLDKALKMNEEDGAKFLAEHFPDEDDMDVAISRLENLAEAYEQFKADGLWKKSTPPNLIAWDLVRFVNLCRNGFDAGLLSQEEALKCISDIAKLLQKEFKSWKELSIAYQFGRYIWGGDDQYEWLKEGMETLLTHNESPWVNLDWNMAL